MSKKDNPISSWPHSIQPSVPTRRMLNDYKRQMIKEELRKRKEITLKKIRDNQAIRDEAEKKKEMDRMSKYFFLIDTKLIANEIHSSEDLQNYVHDVLSGVKDLGVDLASINLDNPTQEDYDKIRSIQIRYAFENVNGPDNPRLTKTGKIDRRGATFHAHGTITFRHHTNLTLNKELFREYMAQELEKLTGVIPFIGKVKYVEGDITEIYMTKSDRYKHGYEWISSE